jgi:hypothetical protein
MGCFSLFCWKLNIRTLLSNVWCTVCPTILGEVERLVDYGRMFNGPQLNVWCIVYHTIRVVYTSDIWSLEHTTNTRTFGYPKLNIWH